MPRTSPIARHRRWYYGLLTSSLTALLVLITPVVTSTGLAQAATNPGIPQAWYDVYQSETPSITLTPPAVDPGYTHRTITAALPAGTSKVVLDRVYQIEFKVTAVSPYPGTVLATMKFGLGTTPTGERSDRATWPLDITGYVADVQARVIFVHTDTPTSTPITVYTDWSTASWPDGSAPGGTPIPPPTDPTTPPSSTPPATTSPPTPPPATADCPKFQVFAIRGSRAGAKDESDKDLETLTFASRFMAKVRGSKTTFIHYAAVPVGYGGIKEYGTNYANSYGSGLAAVGVAVPEFAKRCPSTPFGVVGYSQGANVAGSELAWLSAIYPKTFRWMVVFGDPAHNQDEHQYDAISNGGRRDGILGALPGGRGLLLKVPGNSPAKFRSYCIKGDPFCDYSAKALVACVRDKSQCPHVMYVDNGWTRKGADWAASLTG